MTPLPDLLERVTAASGPDRELDYLIAEWEHPFLAKNRYRRLEGDRGWISPMPPIPGSGHVAAAPDYTGSTDAALALVERRLPNCEWDLDRQLFDGSPLFGCRIFPFADIRNFSGQSTGTPALAVLAALLQAEIARSQEGKT